MAQPELPDNESPRPSNVPLKATPGQFDWVRMHPSISRQNVSDELSPLGYASPNEGASRRSSNSHVPSPNPMTPPSTASQNLHPAGMRAPNNTTNSQRKSRQAAHNVPQNQRLPKTSTPRTLYPATKQTPKYVSAFPNASSGSVYNVPPNPNYPSTQAWNSDQSYQNNGMSPDYDASHNPAYNTTHNQSQLSPFASTEATGVSQPMQSRTLVNDSGWPYSADLLDQGHLESRPSGASADLSSATPRAQCYTPSTQAGSRERDNNFPLDPRLLGPSSHGEPSSLLSANLPLPDFLSLPQFVSRDLSKSPSPNPESLSQSRAEFEASISRQRSESRSTSEDEDDDEIDDFVSDDEDYREFKANLAKARNDMEVFRASQNPERRKNDIVSRGGFKGLRGPRKAAEPTGDIKARLGQANAAFFAGRYPEAQAIVTEVIRINAETHEAWTILASVFMELGRRDKALTALTYAAHLRPKHIDGWLSCARLFLEDTNPIRRPKYLSSAMFCYSAALRADSKNIPARLGKAKIYAERNQPTGAISEYKKVLSLRPRDLELIRNLCAAYYDNSELENARDLYKETFTKFMANPRKFKKDTLNWSDLDSYIAIYQHLDQHEAAIKELSLISRWLLGRESEGFWNNVNDDREWDADALRRVGVLEFAADNFPSSTYGEGLPTELRVKLGLSRLGLGHHEEAMRHFEWLMDSEETGDDNLWNYFDLYRHVADSLYDAKLYEQALKFYQPLKRIPQEATGDLYVQMGFCCLENKLQVQAEECFQTAIQVDENNVAARMELAKMYESLNEQEQAFIYINEVMSIQRTQDSKPVKRRKYTRRRAKVDAPLLVQLEEASDPASEQEDFAPVKHYNYKRHRLADPKGKVDEETTRTEQLQGCYSTLRSKREEMRNGDPEAARAWIKAARELTNDFRSVRSFYPYDKYMRFLGYKEGEARAGAEVPLDKELFDMADRLSKYLGAEVADKTRVPNIEVPENYRGISFSSWLDIFLDFALCLARQGRMKESYEICEAAKDCALFYHSREDLFLIYVCWTTCALFACDEATVVAVARFFMKDYQFTTDSYRMFAAVTRSVHSPVSWYSSGPSQKYILRQIKAMDYALVDAESKEKYFAERGNYSALDENGHLIINEDLDIALLMLYGHILYMGSSYIFALNYFLRALALDPDNPMINLNVGLAYVHHAVKRQAENRQHLILQATTFLFKYYDSRKLSPKIEERQEAHFNMARVYHMLGLTNLAVPYYDLVFKEIEGGDRELSREDLITDAAYNLQTIYAMSGNEELASAITRKWLVI